MIFFSVVRGGSLVVKRRSNLPVNKSRSSIFLLSPARRLHPPTGLTSGARHPPSFSHATHQQQPRIALLRNFSKFANSLRATNPRRFPCAGRHLCCRTRTVRPAPVRHRNRPRIAASTDTRMGYTEFPVKIACCAYKAFWHMIVRDCHGRNHEFHG